MDLRSRIVAARATGASVEEVAIRFGVCTKTVRVYCKRAQEGDLSPRPHLGRVPQVSGAAVEEFVALVRQNNDKTAEELRELWQQQSGQDLARSTFHDHLRRLGARSKKNVARQ